MPISQNLNKTWNSAPGSHAFFVVVFLCLETEGRDGHVMISNRRNPFQKDLGAPWAFSFNCYCYCYCYNLAKLRLCEGLAYLTLVSHLIIARNSAADYQCLPFKIQSCFFFFTLRNSKSWSKLTQFSASSRKRNCIKMKYSFV